MENVPQVHGKKNMDDFQAWLKCLESKGYSNFWHDLNAKNYGVPQSRNRCFMVSILGAWSYDFPEPKELNIRLKDVLEDSVSEKYYINSDRAKKLIERLAMSGTLGERQDRGVSAMRGDGTGVVESKRLGNIYGDQFGTGYAGNVWDSNEIAPTVMTMQGGGRQPMIVDSRGRNPDNPSDRKQGSNVAAENIPINVGNIYESGGQNGSIFDENGISPTISSGSTQSKSNGGVGSCNAPKVVVDDSAIQYRIRKLTPKECWRLMGFDDASFERASQVNSNTQLYKEAGNSIVVDVLEAIFRQML